MRARAIRRGVRPRSADGAATPAGRPSVVALVFLRGRDADGRLRELVAERAQARPVLGALAAALLSGRGFEPLGFRCLGDWSRERLGVGARAVREWARVWRALGELALLREAVLSGEVSWTVARMIVGVVTPENEAACLETVRGRTVRAVEALLRAAAPAEEGSAETSEEDRVAVRVSCSPRVAIAFLQQVDFEIGRILRQVLERKLYRELGFESLERYVQERLDLSPRTARRLVRLARAEHGAPAVASAFREGRITLLQAEVLLRGEQPEALESLETALRVTLRRLEDEVLPRRVAFRAPREVAALFEALVARVGFEAMLDHAIATWIEAGAQFEDYADFTRDGCRCTVPGCTARRNLQSHHIWFRSSLHGSGLHGAAQLAEPSHLVPLGVRAGRGVESHDALCLSPPSRRARREPGDPRAGARWPDLRAWGGEVPVGGREAEGDQRITVASGNPSKSASAVTSRAPKRRAVA